MTNCPNCDTPLCSCFFFDYEKCEEFKNCVKLTYRTDIGEIQEHKQIFNDFVDYYVHSDEAIESFELNHTLDIDPMQGLNLNTGKYDNEDGINILGLVYQIKKYTKKKYIKQYLKTFDNAPERISLDAFIEYINKKYIDCDINCERLCENTYEVSSIFDVSKQKVKPNLFYSNYTI